MHDEENARGFIELYMNEEDLAPLDLSTLKLKNSQLIDKHLSESISDLVYSCEYQDKSQGNARIIILVEHQSTPDKFMPFRVYHYLFNILAYELKNNDNDELLPAVHSMVFYHGQPEEYPYTLKLECCFNDPHKIMKRFWENPIDLINVHKHDDDKLLNQHIEGLMSLALKHGRDQDINDIWLQIIYSILSIDTQEHIRLQFAEQITAYLFAVGKISDKQRFIADVNKLPNPIRGEMMTFADELRAEGRTEGIDIGIDQGINIGVEQVAINCIKEAIADNLIAQLTGLSLERIAQIREEQGL